jgi:hypothetical protein
MRHIKMLQQHRRLCFHLVKAPTGMRSLHTRSFSVTAGSPSTKEGFCFFHNRFHSMADGKILSVQADLQVGTRQNRVGGRCVVRRETRSGEHGTYEVTETPATATTTMCESPNLKLSPVGDHVGVSQLSHTSDTM